MSTFPQPEPRDFEPGAQDPFASEDLRTVARVVEGEGWLPRAGARRQCRSARAGDARHNEHGFVRPGLGARFIGNTVVGQRMHANGQPFLAGGIGSREQALPERCGERAQSVRLERQEHGEVRAGRPGVPIDLGARLGPRCRARWFLRVVLQARPVAA